MKNNKKKFVPPALSIWLFTSDSKKNGGVRNKQTNKQTKNFKWSAWKHLDRVRHKNALRQAEKTYMEIERRDIMCLTQRETKITENNQIQNDI